jgi:RimJ/RimL family protein N-acetyltransferase
MSTRRPIADTPSRGLPVTLRDGSRIRIRQLHRADRDLWLRGFERLSPESRYRRFLSPVARPGARLVRWLTELDHHDHEAVVALDERTGEGIGVARCVRDRERPDAAELALTVIDEWQGRGVGTELLKVLCARARDEGITTLTAVMLATNAEMMDVLEHLGPVRVIERDGPTLVAEVPNPEA